MMRCSRVLIRIVADCAGVFLILSVTAERFDATELTALIMIAALLVTVELAVALSSQRSCNGSARIEPLAVMMLAGLLWVACSKRQPTYYLLPETVAAIAALRTA